MHAADYLIDIGPAAGNLGGEIVAAGSARCCFSARKQLNSGLLERKNGNSTAQRIA